MMIQLLRKLGLASLLAGSLVSGASAVEIVAHRGASADAPENTVVAMKLGFEQQAEAGELDVWISKEGRAVVIHDGDTKRVAGVAKKVADQTLEELQSLDVGKWKDAKFAGTRIPTLEEALATCPPGKRIFVEVKCGPSGVPEILRAIKASGLEPKQTAIISFNADVVAAAKKSRPDLQAYWIVGMQNEKKEVRSLDELIATAQKIGADGLDLSDHPVLDAKAVQKVKEVKLGFYVWTVNDPAAAKRLVQIGVDGITTDRPGFLKQELGLSGN
ncbi:MAG: glycerophosphodiester phosphodiesterase [Planctomycetaceae bacterium]